MQSNFSFLQKEFPHLYHEMVEAEKYTFTAPRHAAVLCRVVLEKTLFWLYEHDEDLTLPYDTKLSSLLFNDDFKQIIKPSLFLELDIIRRFGNDAAHGKKVRQLEALQVLKNTFRFLSWLSKFYSEENPEIPPFDERVIPYGDEKDKTAKQLAELAKQFEEERQQAAFLLKQQQKLAEENEALRAQLAAQLAQISDRKEERITQYKQIDPVPELTSEKQTRKLLIDLLLREAGWNSFVEGSDIEYEVKDMPLSTNPSGKGYIDYVLWDDNGLPLAVVEAKNTLHDPAKGKHQAVLYADCLERKFGQRPIIFYSNGYATYLWDDQFYPPRKVSGFYSKDALQTLLRRRSQRKDLRDFKVNTNIAGRPYQLEAIQRTAENLVTIHQNQLRGKHRKALLVMATGSGKTRTSAAMVDMFTKCDWAKRILFLADRNALVTQAKNAFKEHLPHLTAIDLTKEKDNSEARIVFSTYPTIMNRIDNAIVDGERQFGIGHFDVIIIDEAHRSVYQKYQAIFDYFDAILIGLTATPKKDVDKNTYTLFEIEDDNPTFAYELNDAVAQGHLVPPKGITVPVKFPREGIKYSELSEKDKKQYEEIIGLQDEDENDDDIQITKSQINSFLFNKNTVDIVLDHLMKNGLKIESGDKLGKTIIFAKNHRHAKFIEERFNKNYPEYGGTFLQVIDNYSDKAQDLLERFCYDKGAEKDPQIAVSVDMMDTGVDAPRVLNLVFFKEVKSYAKYWQMIGRGTRLCPNIFGTGEHKEFFLIFDICGNFEFFEEYPDGYTAPISKSLQQKVLEAQVEVVFYLQNNAVDRTAEDQEILELYIQELHAKISTLDETRFEVRQQWEYVNKYKNIDNWSHLNHSAVLEIQMHLSHLVPYMDDRDEMAKKFDLLIYRLELAILEGDRRQIRFIDNIREIGKALEHKLNIPKIKQKEATIKAIATDNYWSAVNLTRLENLRTELRDLIQFLQDENAQQPIYTNFEDDLNEANIRERDLIEGYTSMQNYKDRVEQFILKNKHHLVIDKLYKNIPITPVELQELERFFNEEKFNPEQVKKEFQVDSLSVFVRKILGLDQEAIEQHFATFIQEENLNANQIEFVKLIIRYLVKNGVMDKTMLTEPPFTDLSDSGIFGLFNDTAQAMKIIKLIDEVNENAA